MDRARGVLEPLAHFDRVAECGAQFRRALAHRLPPDDCVVVAAGDDAHETVARFQRHRAAIGGKRKQRTDAVEPGLRRLRRRPADDDHLGIGEAHGGDCGGHEVPSRAGYDLGHHFALRHRAVGEHRLTGQVADRPDAAHRRAALVIDAHGAAIHVEHQRLHPPAIGARPSPDGDQHLIGRQRRLLALRVADAHRIPACVQSLHGAAQMQMHAESPQGSGHRLREFVVIGRQHARQCLDHRHVGAQLAIRRAEFQTDVAGPDHDQALGQRARRQRFGRRDDAPAERHCRQRHRLRARREQQVLADDAQRVLAGGCRDRHRLSVDDAGPAGNDLNAVLLEQRGDAAGEPGDDAILPSHRLRNVDARRLDVDAER